MQLLVSSPDGAVHYDAVLGPLLDHLRPIVERAARKLGALRASREIDQEDFVTEWNRLRTMGLSDDVLHAIIYPNHCKNSVLWAPAPTGTLPGAFNGNGQDNILPKVLKTTKIASQKDKEKNKVPLEVVISAPKGRKRKLGIDPTPDMDTEKARRKEYLANATKEREDDIIKHGREMVSTKYSIDDVN